jgi:GxxExxY protein
MKEDNVDVSDEALSYVIIGCAIDVHRTLGGPGLLESVYEEALCYELKQKNIPVERQIEVPIVHHDTLLATPLRLDLFVNRQIIVECKAVVQYNAIFEHQLLTYLQLTNTQLGLVINFGNASIKNGVRRVFNRKATIHEP